VGGVATVGAEVAVGRAVSVGDKNTVSMGKSVADSSMEGEIVSIGIFGSVVDVITLVFAGIGGRLSVGGITGIGVAMDISIAAVEKRPDKPQQKRTRPASEEIVNQRGLFIGRPLSEWKQPA
jgi:hypothetical protein